MTHRVWCTDCTLNRTFESKAAIPDRFSDGCPVCGAELGVERQSEGGEDSDA